MDRSRKESNVLNWSRKKHMEPRNWTDLEEKHEAVDDMRLSHAFVFKHVEVEVSFVTEAIIAMDFMFGHNVSMWISLHFHYKLELQILVRLV